MKVLVAGGRTIPLSTHWLGKLMESWAPDTTAVIVGKCKGVDIVAEEWARSKGLEVLEYPADWKQHGKAAGPIRNQQMVDVADMLIAVWDGKSRGTADTIRRAKKKGIPVHVQPWPVPTAKPC